MIISFGNVLLFSHVVARYSKSNTFVLLIVLASDVLGFLCVIHERAVLEDVMIGRASFVCFNNASA